MTHQQLREPRISAKPFPQLCNSNLCPHLLGTLTVFLTPPISFPPVTYREYKRVGSSVKCQVGTTQLSQIELTWIYNESSFMYRLTSGLRV